MASDATFSVNPCACPLCGQPNLCAMEEAKRTHQPVGVCWCVNVTFSPALLARVPQAAQRQACICEACVRQSTDSEGASHA